MKERFEDWNPRAGTADRVAQCQVIDEEERDKAKLIASVKAL